MESFLTLMWGKFLKEKEILRNKIHELQAQRFNVKYG